MPDDTSPLDTAIDIIHQNSYPLTSRLNAILYMVEKYEAECLPFLEGLVDNPTFEEEIRGGAALAIGKLGSERALGLLTPLAKQNELNVLRNYSIQALGLLGEEQSIPLLLDALRDDDNVIFYSAAEALGRIGKPVLPYLIDLLQNSPEQDVRCVAAWQLGTLKYAEATPVMLDVIRANGNPDVIALCLWALGEFGVSSEDVLETLNSARSHENPDVHNRAALALKKIARHVN